MTLSHNVVELVLGFHAIHIRVIDYIALYQLRSVVKQGDNALGSVYPFVLSWLKRLI